MRRLRYISIQWGYLMILLGGMIACHADDRDEVATDTIRFNSRALGEGDQLTPVIFFWEEKVWKEFNAGGESHPYLIVHPSKNIDFYRFDSTYYDTQTGYPLEEKLYATGFAPVISFKTVNGKEDFHELFLFPEDETEQPESREKIGKTDFLSCDGGKEGHIGSLTEPFGVKDKELEFRRLTSKIVFIAQRDEDMANKEYIKNVEIRDVKISIGDKKSRLHGPWHFKWVRQSETTGGYEPVATLPMDDSRVFKDQYSDMLMLHQEHRFDSCYVCNPYVEGVKTEWGSEISLEMTIEATHSFYVNFEKSEQRVWENQKTLIYQVEEGEKTEEGIMNFEPGREYRIYLNFHRLGVNLIAKEVDWEEGGLHYVPIMPSDKTAF